ncbi:MAG: nuclear transport factor 2 family protein [Porticoccaceae bacterium]
MTIPNEKLQKLIDQSDIERVLGLYCRAIDRLDLELLRSLYHPDAIDDHGAFCGNAHEFADYIIANLRDAIIDGMHTVTHSVIDIEGDFAASEAYYVAYQTCHGGLENVRGFFGERYADSQLAAGAIDGPQDYICGGRYLDVFERRAGVWKIRHRKITNEWGIVQPNSHIKDQGHLAHFNLPGKRDRTDYVYRISPPECPSLASYLRDTLASLKDNVSAP